MLADDIVEQDFGYALGLCGVYKDEAGAKHSVLQVSGAGKEPFHPRGRSEWPEELLLVHMNTGARVKNASKHIATLLSPCHPAALPCTSLIYSRLGCVGLDHLHRSSHCMMFDCHCQAGTGSEREK